MAIALTTLESYVGKSIADLCQNHFSTPDQNHCAHFVSHALNIQVGVLCGDMNYATRKTGATMRCNELYNNLSKKGPWAAKPDKADGILIFVTASRNVVGGVMSNIPQKHVGIHFGGKVYNFSNSQHKVIVDQSVEAFHTKFKHTYAGNDIALFFAVPQ